jgi:hypothetical protein
MGTDWLCQTVITRVKLAAYFRNFTPRSEIEKEIE